MRLFGLFSPADCFVSLCADDVWLVLDHETAHGAAVDAAQVASHGVPTTEWDMYMCRLLDVLK